MGLKDEIEETLNRLTPPPGYGFLPVRDAGPGFAPMDPEEVQLRIRKLEGGQAIIIEALRQIAEAVTDLDERVGRPGGLP